MLCNQSTASKEAWKREQSKIYDRWISHKSITERFTDPFRGADEHSAARSLVEFVEQKLDLPYNSDYVLDASLIRRINVEIDSYAKKLNSKFSNLFWVVPEGTSKQDPVSRKFYTKLNDILNYERVNSNKVLSANALIADHMLDAYVHENDRHKGRFGKKLVGDKTIKAIRDLRIRMANADPNEHVQSEFFAEVEKLINKDENRTLKQFHELISMDKEAFEDAGSLKNKNVYNSHVYKAVTKAREHLDDMGSVYIKALKSLSSAISLKYTNQSNPGKAAETSRYASGLIRTVNEAVAGIEKSMNDGGYFPHMEFESMMRLKQQLSEAMASEKLNMNKEFGTLVHDILANISSGSIPDAARGRSSVVKKYWDKDPLMVLKEYGDQAAQFNKLVHTQIAYLDALRDLPNTNMRFVKGLKRFIDEEYSVFTVGTGGRPRWVNKAVTTLNALQTARTMGLNITGALKNAASAMHYYSRVGFTTFRDTRKAMNTDEPFRKMMGELENEAGFKFADKTSELYTEGLITKEEQADITFDPLTGKISYKDTPLRDWLAKAGRLTLGGLLSLHRVTENHQRKWMFRTAVYKKYYQLTGNGMDPQQAKTFSKNFGLRMVNSWAYEYAAHAKSKLVRGEWRTIDEMDDGKISSRLIGGAGGISEVAFHLLHYPSSLIESQWSTLKGAHKALLAKQGFGSEEIQYLARYAGVYSLISLAGVLLNMDLTNIFENETQERIERIVSDLTEFDSGKRSTFGLLSEFTGPTIGTMKYAAIASGIIDMEHSDLNKILFGNVDYANPDDKAAELFQAYQYSTAWGVSKNKIWPTLKNGRGRDLLTHYFKMYPSPFTKKYNRLLYNRPMKEKKKTKTSADKAIRILDKMIMA